jgi:hypothetical protein
MEYETCEVTYDSKGSLWWAYHYFLASVSGPHGSYVVATSSQFDRPPVDKLGQRNHAADAPHAELIRQLTLAGWETVDSGPDWFARRLRRPSSSAYTSTDGQSGHSVVLTACGRNKIEVIKVVREATGLGLKEAKDLVERAPVAVSSNLTRVDAERVAHSLSQAGAQVDVR